MEWKGFQRPRRLKYEAETLTPTFGRFFASPYERGFGITVGNAVRRILLSSIEGAGITGVKIEGVLHEFSSIPGVVEDVTDIILNLKQVPIKMHVPGPKILKISRDDDPFRWRLVRHLAQHASLANAAFGREDQALAFENGPRRLTEAISSQSQKSGLIHRGLT